LPIPFPFNLPFKPLSEFDSLPPLYSKSFYFQFLRRGFLTSNAERAPPAQKHTSQSLSLSPAAPPRCDVSYRHMCFSVLNMSCPRPGKGTFPLFFLERQPRRPLRPFGIQPPKSYREVLFFLLSTVFEVASSPHYSRSPFYHDPPSHNRPEDGLFRLFANLYLSVSDVFFAGTGPRTLACTRRPKVFFRFKRFKRAPFRRLYSPVSALFRFPAPVPIGHSVDISALTFNSLSLRRSSPL